MPVCRDIAFKIDPAQLLRSEGNTDNQLIVQSAIWAAQSAKKLARPALVYRFLPCALEEKRLSVGGIFLNIGPMTHLLKHARQVAVGVATVGKGIEKQVRQLQSQNKMLQSYLPGSAAFAVLDAAALHLKALVGQNARRQKWGVGPALSQARCRAGRHRIRRRSAQYSPKPTKPLKNDNCAFTLQIIIFTSAFECFIQQRRSSINNLLRPLLRTCNNLRPNWCFAEQMVLNEQY